MIIFLRDLNRISYTQKNYPKINSKTRGKLREVFYEDINKLFEVFPGAFEKLKLYDFFSEDQYDIKWITKFKKVKYPEVDDYNKKFNNFDKL